MKGSLRVPIRVCLFFTYGISIKTWDELGILDREIFLYKNLAKEGVRVTLFTYGDSTDLDYARHLPDITIVPVYAHIKKPRNKKIAFLQSFWLPLKFRKIFVQNDILKTNQIWGAWVPLLAKYLTGRRLIVRCGYEHYYTLLAERWPSVTERAIFYLFSLITYCCCDHIIVTTKKIADFILRHFFIPKNKISIIPNLIDTELFNIRSDVPSLERRLIYIGRLSTQKNLFNLIRGCKKSGVALDLVGAGELKPELEKEACHLNLDVHFLGICPNSQLPQLLARYQIFILVSFFEGSPKVLIEAMSCGKAVIGADVDGIREFIDDGENGILCGASSDEIAAAILRVKDNTGLQRKLGENARQYILDNYSPSKIIANEFKIYRTIINKKIRPDGKNN